jgi:hypothetical protein
MLTVDGNVVYISLKERKARELEDRRARCIPGEISSWTKDSFSGPKVWCVKVSPDLVSRVHEGDVVLVRNNNGDETYEILSLQIEERPDVWEVEEKPYWY